MLRTLPSELNNCAFRFKVPDSALLFLTVIVAVAVLPLNVVVSVTVPHLIVTLLKRPDVLLLGVTSQYQELSSSTLLTVKVKVAV